MNNSFPASIELVEVLLLTQAMLASAQVGDWSVVESLQRQRQGLLDKFVPTEADVPQIKDILAADAEISARGQAARTTLERAWDDLRRSRAAMDAYGRSGPVSDS